ncbi:MAG: putative endonuclease 4 [Parcubacteria group bacterium GW2011_GWE2_39_37]|uniref:Probable endonuclease 4 n=1 Tax=Candidatus Falkowbacteria bacterium GW2011_GWF2_39_8 TaxID=1618642 RepID=A0A0G0PWL0_9BACT|nr:MAG: putative endonuclease 4 [Parcubacteria group bacterium GW2011_GWE2_39_37]KKR32559.1 MAG: putative endonuclease 4 [Candidatus Falkowbacteria bacterium GW2011_GWF2_39_8]
MKPKIGAHVSAAGGLYKCFDNAKKIGAECIQIFGASPRAWRTKIISVEDANKFKQVAKEANFDLSGVYLHASYLVNLANVNEENRQLSICNLTDHLRIADSIGAHGLIFHLGSSGEEPDKNIALQKTVSAMQAVLKAVPGKACLIMENSAGGGNKLGFRFSEIGEILKKVGSNRVKVCLDTAHIFAAGGIEEYTPKNIKALFDEFENEIGLKNLVALHINDSKTLYNSHHDRHENLGEGHIGLEGFKNLAKEKRLWDKDWILEVPGFDNEGPDLKNMEILKGLFT